MTDVKPHHQVALKHRGAHAELLATVWLLRQGYEVFRNISDSGLADLVAWKEGSLPILLDVKSTAESFSKVRGHYVFFKSLKSRQIEMGVRPIYVLHDGTVTFGPETAEAAL